MGLMISSFADLKKVEMDTTIATSLCNEVTKKRKLPFPEVVNSLISFLERKYNIRIPPYGKTNIHNELFQLMAIVNSKANIQEIKREEVLLSDEELKSLLLEIYTNTQIIDRIRKPPSLFFYVERASPMQGSFGIMESIPFKMNWMTFGRHSNSEHVDVEFSEFETGLSRIQMIFTFEDEEFFVQDASSKLPTYFVIKDRPFPLEVGSVLMIALTNWLVVDSLNPIYCRPLDNSFLLRKQGKPFANEIENKPGKAYLKLRVIKGKYKDSVFRIDVLDSKGTDTFKIGRDAENDIQLLDGSVSRKHAEIIFDRGAGWFIMESGFPLVQSGLFLKNITEIRESKFSSKYLLEEGMKIGCGDNVFRCDFK